MSHTYSRTRALFNDFADAFTGADEVILHKIYSSARETEDPDVTGEKLYYAVDKRLRKAGLTDNLHYFHEVMDALPYLKENLGEGDLFLTMGAGDNWRVGHALYQLFSAKERDYSEEHDWVRIQ
jgi:UDP-N-acetylmuramate--alanine ligase